MHFIPVSDKIFHTGNNFGRSYTCEYISADILDMGIFDKRIDGLEITKGYYFEQLSEYLRPGYEVAAAGMIFFKRQVQMPAVKNKDDIKKIMEAVIYDNPLLCYINTKEYQIIRSGFSRSIGIEYMYDRHKAQQIIREIDKEANFMISQIITEDMDDYQKCLAVHDYLAENIRYNFSAMHVDTAYDAHTPEGALLRHQAVCEGIAKAMSLILQKLGIYNLIVIGESEIERERVGHAWNMVRIGKNFYHIDVTWDLQEVNHFTSRSHTYMNLNDESMLMNHVWDLQNYPTCDCNAENYYVREKRYFRSMHSFELYVQKSLGERLVYMDVRFEDTLDIPDDGGKMLSEKIQKAAKALEINISFVYMYQAGTCVFQAKIDYL